MDCIDVPERVRFISTVTKVFCCRQPRIQYMDALCTLCKLNPVYVILGGISYKYSRGERYMDLIGCVFMMIQTPTLLDVLLGHPSLTLSGCVPLVYQGYQVHCLSDFLTHFPHVSQLRTSSSGREVPPEAQSLERYVSRLHVYAVPFPPRGF